MALVAEAVQRGAAQLGGAVEAVEHVAAFGVVAFGLDGQGQVVGAGFALLAGQVAELVVLAGLH
ncbi:MAG: hypothetical protein EOO59_06925 [Hymenobacter sp.]|nr:MAG: hypothetical protein EOO59_06925 [Hymenobacter sp.]